MSTNAIVLICAVIAALSLYTGGKTRPARELQALFWIALAGPEYWRAARHIRGCQADPERIAELELECDETEPSTPETRSER